MDGLPKIQISPLEGNYFLTTSVPALLIFLVLALISKGFLSAFFWILTFIIGLFTFANIYGRLSSKWRRLHYPLMVRYAKAAGFIHGVCKKKNKDFDVDLALRALLLSVFPKMSDFLLSRYLQSIYDWENNFGFDNKRTIKQFFKKKNPDVDETKLREMVKIFKRSFADCFTSQDRKDANFIKIRLVIAELIKMEYGASEALEYLYAVVTGKAN